MDPFSIPETEAGATLAAVLRGRLPGQSWKQVRQVVAGRRVRVNGELCLDPARRLKAGDAVELLGRPDRLPEAFTEDLVVRHLDGHVVVVEKPPGINTVRHPSEGDWRERRRNLSPTLEDRLPKAVADRPGARPRLLPPLGEGDRPGKLNTGPAVV